ncbi:MAG TPA: carboxypeptidase regulatory-like domain-containing protein, partial [Candidatus Eisenbacteria bacterium]|nr:carboxypeptidase regulatory-like domain-containing protein [Candidatus Eisenbacteria bacterium]
MKSRILSLRSSRSVHAFLLFGLFVLGGMFLPSGPADAQTPRTSLSGRVLDAASRSPLAEVRVRWTGPGAGETVTDASGRFRFEPAGDGAGTLEALRLGYRPVTSAIGATESEVEILLEAQPIASPLVEVTTTRPSERGSAVAFTRLD